ncbi:unnamed protein product [Bursaphelenchus okinawaensis]|uniref:Glucose-methanol-choline oxidoreductase N-terminal domain-containing protein n=1 Tax=Bursaphelenchus okinawaensis TaxID=465554 RepID=A0A811KNQ9_9BILA|nr:unnamed protein product [Bursaphelenchus okinawaensis]CAG9107531.1 unnamed protein product [Bursaphelenchus okinawaensis]
MEAKTIEEGEHEEKLLWLELGKKITYYKERVDLSRFDNDPLVLDAEKDVRKVLLKWKKVEKRIRFLKKKERKDLKAVEEPDEKHGRDRSVYEILPQAGEIVPEKPKAEERHGRDRISIYQVMPITDETTEKRKKKTLKVQGVFKAGRRRGKLLTRTVIYLLERIIEAGTHLAWSSEVRGQLWSLTVVWIHRRLDLINPIRKRFTTSPTPAIKRNRSKSDVVWKLGGGIFIVFYNCTISLYLQLQLSARRRHAERDTFWGGKTVGTFTPEIGDRKPTHLIVRAGAAGYVLANRLTENPDNLVLLLEAGPKDEWYNWKIHMPAALMYNLCNDKYNWYYHTMAQKHMGNRVFYWPRGRVWGGSTSLNAMAYVRGHPMDSMGS